jgi:hypothetical protein
MGMGLMYHAGQPIPTPPSKGSELTHPPPNLPLEGGGADHFFPLKGVGRSFLPLQGEG